ncbi:DUF4184 family protein [Streptomyces sp. CB03238]|uniref:DUF4184 family protein n=1 Tax=Streptomyces sp. CB03238 TaxID=1907777 RepID=UPI000A119653|nr:DUF4184 family protein [Streptomyces sp. CB03238]ORT54453.1 hypothetical protein BKD26_35195 [Streptomyces sp. CB03238]
MPFTLSHAAAVLPGIRRSGTGRGPLVASALVMGSFSPDMTYFADTAIPGAMLFGDVTHSLVGILTVDVLIAAALVAVWLMVREPLLALVPARWQGRVHTLLRGQSWRGRHPAVLAFRFYASAVIGAATHVVWDLFTHADRWGTRVLPALGEVVAGFPMYMYAQYGGSAVALVVLVWFVGGALRRVPPEAAGEAPASVPVLDRRGRWLAAGLLGACVAAGIVHRCVRWYAYWGRIDTPLDIVPTACFGAGAGLAAGLLLYGAGMRLRAAGRRPAG